jgi:hypothetical protein
MRALSLWSLEGNSGRAVPKKVSRKLCLSHPEPHERADHCHSHNAADIFSHLQ